jgi:glycosyltransferase involved in cell wall biosynthesis
MKKLRQRGHDVRCICNSWNNGDFPSRLDEIGVPYDAIPLGRLSASLRPKYVKWSLNALLYLPVAYYRYWQTVRGFDPDIVIFNNVVSASTLRPIVRANHTVHYVHSFLSKSLHARRVFRAFNAEKHAFIAVSESVRRHMLDLGVAPSEVETIHNGVPIPEAPVAPDAPPDSPMIGIVGQVGPWKGHDDLFSALHRLHQDGYDIRCTVFGTGESDYVDALKERTQKWEIDDQITWWGYESDQDVMYEEIDVVAVPSRRPDPFPMVPLEAGSRGIPAIATYVGGLPEGIIDGETGFLVDPESPDQVADRLRRFLDDPSLCRSMGKKAREHVTNSFSEDRMVDDVESLLRRVHQSEGAHASV